MLNEENFDMIVTDAVGNDVSKVCENKFACSLDLAASSEESILRQQALYPPVY